jgi:hypothetical protein
VKLFRRAKPACLISHYIVNAPRASAINLASPSVARRARDKDRFNMTVNERVFDVDGSRSGLGNRESVLDDACAILSTLCASAWKSATRRCPLHSTPLNQDQSCPIFPLPQLFPPRTEMKPP